MLQGNTYELGIQLFDNDGNIVLGSDVTKGQFIFGKTIKTFGQDGTVTYDTQKKCFIVPLTEDETFDMQDHIMWQCRLLFNDGSIDATCPKSEIVTNSLTLVALTPVEEA